MEEGREPPKDPDFLSNFRKGVERAHRNLDQRIVNPQTPPSRFLSSTFSSPGSIIGKEEDAVIIQLDQRYLLAGIEGESSPQCKITFTPNTARRVGDYRVWLPGYKHKQESLDTWGYEYELWRNNIEELDLGLVGDRLERAVREAYNKHLLLDAGSSRLVLVVPSIVPHPVLETLLSTLFQRWSYSAITLLPAPTMTSISAGLRSALVIDIGWEETIITSIYEYREVQSHRSTRAMKEMTKRFAAGLKAFAVARTVDKGTMFDAKNLRIDLEFVEQVLTRTLPSTFFSVSEGEIDRSQKPTIIDQDTMTSEISSRDVGKSDYHEIEWPSGARTEVIQLPKSVVASAVQDTFLNEEGDIYPDDHELSIPVLAFKSLSSLSADQRSRCMSRIVFAGEGSKTPWVRLHVLERLKSLSHQNGWSDIKGQHIKSKHVDLAEGTQLGSKRVDAKYGLETEAEKDYIEELVRKQKARKLQQVVPAELREVKSLGPWAGASLLANLKVRGFVEVERDRFLSHGLAGASRDTHVSVIPQPQRLSSFGITKAVKVPDRTSWTLAGWG